MWHLHPPSQNCYVLDRMEFLHFIYEISILIAFFSQKCPSAPGPPRQISGYATGGITLRQLSLVEIVKKMCACS